jgi:hypothetical protein
MSGVCHLSYPPPDQPCSKKWLNYRCHYSPRKFLARSLLARFFFAAIIRKIYDSHLFLKNSNVNLPCIVLKWPRPHFFAPILLWPATSNNIGRVTFEAWVCKSGQHTKCAFTVRFHYYYYYYYYYYRLPKEPGHYIKGCVN